MAAVLIGVSELPRDVTSRKAAARLSGIALQFRDVVQSHPAASAIVDDLQDAADEIVRLTAKIRILERQLKVLIAEVGVELMSLHGISHVVAAGLIGHAGDLRNYRNAGAFAAKCGAAPRAILERTSRGRPR
jgi:hypothetical protein